MFVVIQLSFVFVVMRNNNNNIHVVHRIKRSSDRDLRQDVVGHMFGGPICESQLEKQLVAAEGAAGAVPCCC